MPTEKQKWAMWRNSTIWSLKGIAGNLRRFEHDRQLPDATRAKVGLATQFLDDALYDLRKLNTYEKFKEKKE